MPPLFCNFPVLNADNTVCKPVSYTHLDLTRTDVSYAVTEAFRCGKTVLAWATYDGFLFPPMEALLTHLKTKNFQNRTVGLMENGTWAPMAAKLMRAELDGMKNMTVCDTVVTIRSADVYKRQAWASLPRPLPLSTAIRTTTSTVKKA